MSSLTATTSSLLPSTDLSWSKLVKVYRYHLNLASLQIYKSKNIPKPKATSKSSQAHPHPHHLPPSYKRHIVHLSGGNFWNQIQITSRSRSRSLHLHHKIQVHCHYWPLWISHLSINAKMGVLAKQKRSKTVGMRFYCICDRVWCIGTQALKTLLITYHSYAIIQL